MNIQYKTKIVAFIDVLGFSSLVYSNDTDVLNRYFDFLQSKLSLYLKKFDSNDSGFLIISDSIVIVIPNSESNLITLSKSLSVIQSQLLVDKILIRGAITIGDVFFDKEKNIIVGPAIIKAYNLEGKTQYPRIIFDREILMIPGMTTIFKGFDFKTWLDFTEFNSANSGYISIDYVKYLVRTTRNFKQNRFDNIIKLISQHIYANTNYEKYAWLKNKILYYLNYQIRRHSKQTEDGFATKHSRKMYIRCINQLKALKQM